MKPTSWKFKRGPILSVWIGSLYLASVGIAGSADAADTSTPNKSPAGIQTKPALMIPDAYRSQLLGIASAGTHLTAVGVNGVLVSSEDGDNWKQLPSPIDVTLTNIAFADEQRGWAVGHDAVILGTEDGGLTWKVQSIQPDLYTPLFSVLPLDAQNVYAVGAFGTIKHTTDGGKIWGDVDATGVSDAKLHLNAITALRSKTLVVVGEQGLIGVSADGVKWTRASVPYEGSFFGVAPWGEHGAVVFGMRGTVFVSQDVLRGEWRKVETGMTASLFGYEVTPDGRTLLLGAESAVLVLDTQGDLKRLRNDKVLRGQTLTDGVTRGKSLLLVGDTGIFKLEAP